MSVIPCERNDDLRDAIEAYAEALAANAHALGDHGLNEQDFHASGIFRGAIERLRGQFSAGMAEKRDFVRRVLNHMEDTTSSRGGSPPRLPTATTTRSP